MTVKAKIIISMVIVAFLAAIVVLITDALLFSYFIDSNQVINKARVLLIFIFTGLLVTVVFLGISFPYTLFIAKNVSSLIEKTLDNTNIDALTGIYNRRYLDENLKPLIGFMSRSGGKLTLMMIGIDFFKKYNDTYGYSKGDTCLKIVAHTLSRSVTRAEDFVARYGGKDFAVVMPNTDENGAQLIAKKLLQAIQDCKIPHETSGAAACVTISAGVITGKADHSQSGDEYVSRAAELLNRSIQEGCNRYTSECL